jgi:hypothetical protein
MPWYDTNDVDESFITEGYSRIQLVHRPNGWYVLAFVAGLPGYDFYPISEETARAYHRDRNRPWPDADETTTWAPTTVTVAND